MFTVEHERNINQNLLILYDESVKEKGFAEKMLVQNLVEGLLKVRTRTLNHKIQYCYDITKLQSLEVITERTSMKKDELIKFIKELFYIIQSSNSYLLEENDFVLLPEYIFFHISTKKIKLCYFPKYEKSLKVQLNCLFEYLMNRIDYKEQEAVVFLYQLYMKSKEPESNFSDLAELLLQEKINSKQENFKCEQESIKEELILEEKLINLEKEELEESEKESNTILNNMESEEKEKRQMEYEKEYSKSVEDNKYNIKENKEEIQNQEVKRKFVNKQKAEFFGMQEKFENEIEELYYPFACYGKMAGIIILSLIAFAALIHFKVIYNSLGTELEITKCVISITIIGIIIFFVYHTTFSPENKYIRMKRIASYAPLSSEEKSEKNKRDEKKGEKFFLKQREKMIENQKSQLKANKRYKDVSLNNGNYKNLKADKNKFNNINYKNKNQEYNNSLFEMKNKKNQEEKEQKKKEQKKVNQEIPKAKEVLLEESRLEELSKLNSYSFEFNDHNSEFKSCNLDSKEIENSNKEENTIINQTNSNKIRPDEDILDKKNFISNKKFLDTKENRDKENFINLIDNKNSIDNKDFFNSKIILNDNSLLINPKEIINPDNTIDCNKKEETNRIKKISSIDEIENIGQIEDINKSDRIYQTDKTEYEENNETIVLYEEETQENILLKLFPIDFYIYQPICITATPFFIGKLKTQMDLCIERPTISRFHSKITKEEEKFLIYDLNTTNGTFLNGVRIPPNGNMELHNKDTISFADVSYRVEL